MKNSFWGAVGFPFEIKPVEKETLMEAINVAFDSNEYGLYNSRWFIDVKERFRIFRYRGTPYIVKETSEKKADSEVVNSKKAYDKLDGKTVGTKTIRIVIPKKFTLSSDNKRNFLVSEYLGPDLNEKVYSNTRPRISLGECLSFVGLFLENGIAYKGFLPRNIVEEKNTIYLFDWEDASFSDSRTFDSFDHPWRTNFLLNWSYLFDHADLDNGLKRSVGIQEPLSEPPLVEYENIFRDITNNKTSDASLRNDIDNIVFGSELPLVETPDRFYIRQNDIGCLIPDIFPSEFDVLYDMLSYVFRMIDERKFSYHIELITYLLIGYYKAVLVQNHSPKLPLRYYALIPILMMIDKYISEDEYKYILSANTLSESLTKIIQTSEAHSITRFFLSKETDSLPQLLDVMLRDRITKAFPRIEKGSIKNIDKIITFILRECTQAQTQNQS